MSGFRRQVSRMCNLKGLNQNGTGVRPHGLIMGCSVTGVKPGFSLAGNFHLSFSIYIFVAVCPFFLCGIYCCFILNRINGCVNVHVSLFSLVCICLCGDVNFMID